MPARKPAALQRGNDTNLEKAQRVAAEAMSKSSPIAKTPPRELKGFEVARNTWRTIVGDFLRTEGMELDKLDKHVLLDLCMAEEDLTELIKMRVVTFSQWEENAKDHRASQATFREMAKNKGNHYEITEARKVALALLKKNQELYKAILSLDARIDAKRKLKFTLYQSMYLTPRSRAGANPDTKEDEGKKPVSGMAALFGSPVKVGPSATRGEK